jgi:hypothetical protein
LARPAELDGLNLRVWAHTLGFRGRVPSKQRLYVDDVSGSAGGGTPAEAENAAGIVEDLAGLEFLRRLRRYGSSF